jgi:CheY-like chemotaxis protein
MYNVLWFEDEDYKFERFREIAELKGFKLHPVGVRQKGIDELKLHPDRYDAVLLDAEMPERSEHEVAGTSGIKDVVQVTTELHIPLFVSTGKDHIKNNEFFRQSFTNVFVKGFPDKSAGLGGDDELFAAMTEALGQLEKTKIKRLYADVITALSAIGIEEKGTEILLPILCKMHNPDEHTDFSPILHYTQLRILIEYIFRALNKYGILPDAFINDDKQSNNGRRGVNLDMSCKYLQGAEASHIPFKAKEAIFPIQIGRNISSIIYFANNNSHSTQLEAEDEKLIREELSKPRAKYILYSFTMMLSEAIIWTCEYIAEHPSYAQNQAQWICTETPEETPTEKPRIGEIVQLSRDAGGNVFAGRAKVQWSLFKDVSDEELANTKYKILNVQDTAPTDKVFDKYPYFIKVRKV